MSRSHSTSTARASGSLHLLGSWELVVEGRVRDVPRASQRLVALCALKGRVARGTVAGILWPDAGEDAAAGRLRTALWRLSDGRPVVDVRGDELVLSPTVVVDVDRLRSFARALAAGCDDAGDGAVAWLGDDLLPGWYDDWLVVDRERVRQQRLHALEALSALRLRQRRYADAVDTGLLATECEPLRESAHRAVVAAYLAEGNVTEAIRHFDTYRVLLLDEVGIEPTDEFAALVPTRSPAARPVAVVPPARAQRGRALASGRGR
jgi:DNA-binding SARP family transcriptional activator